MSKRAPIDPDEAKLLRQCLGKTGWPTWQDADASRKTRGKMYYKLNVYKCELCSLWHLGHRTGTR